MLSIMLWWGRCWNYRGRQNMTNLEERRAWRINYYSSWVSLPRQPLHPLHPPRLFVQACPEAFICWEFLDGKFIYSLLPASLWRRNSKMTPQTQGHVAHLLSFMLQKIFESARPLRRHCENCLLGLGLRRNILGYLCWFATTFSLVYKKINKVKLEHSSRHQKILNQDFSKCGSISEGIMSLPSLS